MTTNTDPPTECEHEWAYEQKLMPVYPPIQRKICVKCETLTQERGMTPDFTGRFDTTLAAKEAKKNAQG